MTEELRLRYGERQYPGNVKLKFIGPLCIPTSMAKYRIKIAEQILEEIPELTGITFCGRLMSNFTVAVTTPLSRRKNVVRANKIADILLMDGWRLDQTFNHRFDARKGWIRFYIRKDRW